MSRFWIYKMKLFSMFLISMFLVPMLRAENFDSMTSMIHAELRETSRAYQEKISQINRQISTLKKQRSRIVTQSKQLANLEKKGLTQFKRYISLLEVRYTDDQGDFVPGKRIAKNDIDNINLLFRVYLKKVGLSNAASAERAINALEDGIDALGELVDIHANPDSSNNSKLQIIEDQLERAKEAKDVAVSMVKKLGLKGVNLNALPKGPAKSPSKSKKSPEKPSPNQISSEKDKSGVSKGH